jgi:hypothetical protein
MFTNKLLIQISGLSERTYYRKLKALKDLEIINKKDRSILTDKQAFEIAEKMGFENSIKEFNLSRINKIR